MISKLFLTRLVPGIAVAFTLAFATATAAPGTAGVRVVTLPASSGSLQFAGTPAGVVQLGSDGSSALSADAAPGRHKSMLVEIGASLQAAGYRLSDIACDDSNSARPSRGSLPEKAAIFEIGDAERVVCTFTLSREDVSDPGGGNDGGGPGSDPSAPGGTDPSPPTSPGASCLCPKSGRWAVNNHTGSMTCTGVMSMVQPLKAARGRGSISVNGDCSRAHAEGMSDDEAAIDMTRQPDCSWTGAVGGSTDGIPMTINFRWRVESEQRITGDLSSTVSQQGMTCRMARTYELDYEG